MARTVVGYEGKGRWRRTLYRDDGPARGRTGGTGGSDALSRLGAQVVPSRFLTGDSATTAERGGHGAIERRQATDAQRAAWAAEREAPDVRPPAATRAIAPTYQPKPEQMARGSRPGTESFQAASRARGAARAGFTPGATKPYLAARQSAPVTAPPSLEEGSVVAQVSSPASNGHTNIPDPIPGSPQLIVPCGDCAKADVCSIRPTLDLAEIVEQGPARHPAIHLRVIVDCSAYLAAGDRPAPATEPAEGLTKRMAETLDAVRATSGNMTRAARRMAVDTSTVRQMMLRIRERGLMPADVGAMLDGRARDRQARESTAHA